MSRLILVPTPIGNLGDITIRALEVLRSAGLVLAEDTRTTRILLDHYGISVPLRSHHKFNEHRSLRACTGMLRPAIRPLLFRGIPSTEKGETEKNFGPGRGRAHNGFL